MSRQVPASEGERCSCGRPAVVAVLRGYVRVPWCGQAGMRSPHPSLPASVALKPRDDD